MQFGKLKLLQIFERNWNDLPLKYWTIISFVDIKWETSDQLWAQLSASSHLNEETKFFEAFTFPWFLYYTAWFIFNSSAIGNPGIPNAKSESYKDLKQIIET